MFFSNTEVILFLDRNRLALFAGEQSRFVSIPKNTVSFLTVLNIEEYVKLLNNFFSEAAPEGKKADLILARDIVFTKKIDNGVDSGNLEKEFLRRVPIQEENLATVKVDYGDATGLFATNSDLYLPIVNEGAKFGITVNSVVPAFIFKNLNSSENVDKDVLGKISSNRGFLREANFLKQNEEISVGSNQGVTESKQSPLSPWYTKSKNLVMLFVALSLLLCAGVLIAYAFRDRLLFIK